MLKKLFSVLIILWIYSYQLATTSASMIRLVFNQTDCSDSENLDIDYILELARAVNRNAGRRLLVSTSKQTDVKDNGRNADLVRTLLKSMKNQVQVTKTSTIEHTNHSLSSTRELYPAYCADLCAGYVPRRCRVTNCVGYRRNRHLRVLEETCDQMIVNGEYVFTYFIENNMIPSSCAMNRTWTCIPNC